MKSTVKIDNIGYILDIDQAQKLGLLTPKEIWSIDDIKPGVEVSLGDLNYRIITIIQLWSPANPTWSLGGRDGNPYKCFSDGPYTTIELVKYLNDNGFKKFDFAK